MNTNRRLSFWTIPLAAGLIGGRFLEAEEPAEQDGASRRDPIVGTWIVTVSPTGGPPPFTAISTFNPGGGYIQVDNSRPPSIVTPGLEQWSRRRWKLTSALEFSGFVFAPDGNFLGPSYVYADLELSTSLDSFTGTYEFKTLDRNGNVILAGGGVRSAVRLRSRGDE